MTKLAFDVNDAALREAFLREQLVAALAGLEPTAAARWGDMRPQQMVEHLAWVFRVSTGLAQATCGLSADEQMRLRPFLNSNRPSPRSYMNPMLAEGLPPLRSAGLAAAVADLQIEVRRFLDEPASAPPRTHPIFGAIGHEDWHRTHYKHAHHHLLQFGLIEHEQA